jgi:hypothetical protein
MRVGEVMDLIDRRGSAADAEVLEAIREWSADASLADVAFRARVSDVLDFRAKLDYRTKLEG